MYLFYSENTLPTGGSVDIVLFYYQSNVWGFLTIYNNPNGNLFPLENSINCNNEQQFWIM